MDFLVLKPRSVSLRMTRATTYLNHFQSSYAIAVAGDAGGAGVDSLGRKEGEVWWNKEFLSSDNLLGKSMDRDGMDDLNGGG